MRSSIVGSSNLIAPYAVFSYAGVDFQGRCHDESQGPAPWMTKYLHTYGGTISAGASEIQRNIIAQRVLGLPRR